ncbi:MAG: hypothetical protein JWL75_219 [Parcubacteria group bacterium]|nr:hypothetical protein [Parcubacteria group bacterium]
MESYKYNPDRIKRVPGQEGPVLDVEKAQIMAEEENRYFDFAEMYKTFSENPEHYLEAYPLMDAAVEQYIELSETEPPEEDDSFAEPKGEIIFKAEFGGKKGEKETSAKEHAHTMAILEGHPEVKKYLENPEEYEASHPTSSEGFKDFVQMNTRGVSPDYLRKIGEVHAEVLGAEKDHTDAVKDMSPKELKRLMWKSRFTMLSGTINAFVAGAVTEEAEYVKVPDYWNSKIQVMLSKRIADVTREELGNIKNSAGKGERGSVIPENPAVDALRTILTRLDAKHGPEKVTAALARLHGVPSSKSVMFENLMFENLSPASSDLIKELVKLGEKFEDHGDILDAMIVMEDERGADTMQGSRPWLEARA